MLGNFSVLILLISIILMYLKISESYFHVCKYVEKDSNFFDEFMKNFTLSHNDEDTQNIMKNNIEKLKTLCKEYELDYSSNPFMNMTLGKLDDMIYHKDKNSGSKSKNNNNTNLDHHSSEKNYYDENFMKMFLNSMDPESLRLSLFSIKIAHFLLYGLVLYTLVISFPNAAVEILLFFLNKILFIIFGYLVSEALLKFFFPEYLENITWFIKEIYKTYLNYLPFNLLGNPIKILLDLLNFRNLF
jgi:hypothetical protein